ncbi:hypothetical protein F5Y03DRAFT_383436 [Xylaria venustula]|nr:hypothetical protein F5Y03DRAFT_383436 [Xylaria venustula]
MILEVISLLPTKNLLRELLLACREYLQISKVSDSVSLEMWITGGWVCDKLLDIPCSDIDIALSTMTGERFGHFLTEFLYKIEESYKKRATELKVPYAKFSSFHTTKKNLGKSKKLETAVGTIFGLDLDLVNLRKGVYEEDSRTQKMEFGTTEEDAFRRDATEALVDLTHKGLDGMAACILRTPLEPQMTFLDDPLRVLRLKQRSGRKTNEFTRH